MAIDSLITTQSVLSGHSAVQESQRDAQTRQQQQPREVTHYPKAQVVIRQGNTHAFAQADRYHRDQAVYDQPHGRAGKAIDAYQSLQRQQQQHAIHQSLGVDTYA